MTTTLAASALPAPVVIPSPVVALYNEAPLT